MLCAVKQETVNKTAHTNTYTHTRGFNLMTELCCMMCVLIYRARKGGRNTLETEIPSHSISHSEIGWGSRQRKRCETEKGTEVGMKRERKMVRAVREIM